MFWSCIPQEVDIRPTTKARMLKYCRRSLSSCIMVGVSEDCGDII